MCQLPSEGGWEFSSPFGLREPPTQEPVLKIGGLKFQFWKVLKSHLSGSFTVSLHCSRSFTPVSSFGPRCSLILAWTGEGAEAAGRKSGVASPRRALLCPPACVSCSCRGRGWRSRACVTACSPAALSPEGRRLAPGLCSVFWTVWRFYKSHGVVLKGKRLVTDLSNRSCHVCVRA